MSYKEFLSSVAAQEHDRVKEKIDTAIKFNRPLNINYRVILPGGTQLHILNRCEIICNENGVAEMMLGAVQDVTPLKNVEEEGRLLAFYDGLTGLANRTLFMDRLDHEISSAKRHGTIFSLLFLDLDPGNLEVEITENIFMHNTKDTIGILNQLKDLKLKIALDHFGTGYSSLSYLTSFPVDVIKNDRSFIMGCTVLEKNHVIIKAIVAMGHSLGMKIVAEGIETEEELELIKGYGADEGQGYCFSPPIPRQEFAQLLTGIGVGQG